MMVNFVLDKVLGHPIRTITTPHKSIFLTFDDGPEPGMTEQVLDLLDTFGVKATFFVIAEKAQKYPNLLREVQRRGHSIGNHSLDHRFSRYFKGHEAMLSWISDSEKIISDLLGEATIGFRPPWGMRTPVLSRVLEQLQMPTILWNTRFYDAVFPWTPKKALESIREAESGAIVLLHDRQPDDRMPLFLEALQVYIDAAKKDAFEMSGLRRAMLTF
jgi:peptidoglycan/xylan/chitin deacetylase (PgdA/CDA1 family)